MFGEVKQTISSITEKRVSIMNKKEKKKKKEFLVIIKITTVKMKKKSTKRLKLKVEDIFQKT